MFVDVHIVAALGGVVWLEFAEFVSSFKHFNSESEQNAACPGQVVNVEVDSVVNVADVCGCGFFVDDDVCVADVFSLIVWLEFNQFGFLSYWLVIT